MPHIAGLRGALPDASGAVVRDPSRAVYRYHQVFARDGRTFVRKTLVAAVKLAPYADGTIRPHLATTAAAREAELAKIRATRTHAAMVFAGYRDAALEVDRQFRKLEDGKPTSETVTADGTTHRLWRVQSAEILGALRHLFAPKKLHLLDGHARYEAMLAYSEELDAKQPLAMYSSGKYGLFALVNVDDPTLVVAPRHRLVRGLTAKPADVLAAAKPAFIVEKVSRDPAKLALALGDSVAHQPAFAIAFRGEPDAWKLTLSPDVSITGEGIAVHRALQKLDPIVVDRFFAPRCLTGATLTSTLDLAAAVASDADAAIATRAVPLDQILHTDELGQLLPEDSTAFAPALADVVSFAIDPDEDLV